MVTLAKFLKCIKTKRVSMVIEAPDLNVNAVVLSDAILNLKLGVPYVQGVGDAGRMGRGYILERREG